MPSSSSSNDISLSIQETNKLRASLGLPLLELTTTTAGNDDANKQQQHETASNGNNNNDKTNNDNTATTTTTQEKLASLRRTRGHLKKWKGASLGDEDADEDLSTWLQKHKQQQQQPGTNRNQNTTASTNSKTTSKVRPSSTTTNSITTNFTVHHDKKLIPKGQDTILTLKDQHVLDDSTPSDSPQLENAELYQQEKRQYREKRHRGEGLYDYVESLEEYGDVSILPKYDAQRLDMEASRKSFKLGDGNDDDDASKRRRDNADLVVLNDTNATKKASDYMTIEEMKLKRRKKKGKRSMRKRKRSDTSEADSKQPNAKKIKTNDENAEQQQDADKLNTTNHPTVYAKHVNVQERKSSLLEQEKQRRLAYDTAMKKAQDVSDMKLSAMEDFDAMEAEDVLQKLERRSRRRQQQSAATANSGAVSQGTGPGGVHPRAADSVLDRSRSLEQTIKSLKQEEDADQEESNEAESKEFMPATIAGNGPDSNESNSIRDLREKLRAQPKKEQESMEEEEDDEQEEVSINARRFGEGKKRSLRSRAGQVSQTAASPSQSSVAQSQTNPSSTAAGATEILKEPILDRGLYTAIVFARQRGILQKLSALKDAETTHATRPASSLNAIDNRREEFKKLNYAFYGMRKSKSKLAREHKRLERQKRIQSMSSTDTPYNALQALRNTQEATGSALIQVGRSMDSLSMAAAAHRLAKEQRKRQQQEEEASTMQDE